MQGFLLRSIQRRLQRIALGATFGMAVVTTTAVFTGGFGDPTTGVAAHRAELQAASCENLGEKTTVASRVAPQDRAAGTALSCAGGDLYLGDGDRPDRKAGNRATLKQPN